MKAFSVSFYLKGTRKKTGKAALFCRLIHDRQMKSFRVGPMLYPHEWDKKTGRATDQAINEELIFIESKLHEARRLLVYQGLPVTLDHVVDMVQGKTKELMQLGECLEKYAQHINDSVNHRETTKRRIKSNVKLVSRFLKESSLVTFEVRKVNEDFCKQFEKCMNTQTNQQTKTSLARSYKNRMHKALATVLNYAVGKNILAVNPYNTWKKPVNNASAIKYLTIEELHRLKSHDLGGNESLARVRDIFVFCCYTGLRYGDAMALEKDNFTEVGHKGESRLILSYTQQKTGTRVEIPCFKEAVAIIDQYKATEFYQLTGRLFYPIANAKINSYLKVIADFAGISKNLHFHMARHTCGTYLLSQGLHESMVAAMLGHKSPVQTRIYAKILTTSLLDALDMVEEKVVQQMKSGSTKGGK